MKKVLINHKEYGSICQIVNPGEEFEVHKDFSWIDCNEPGLTEEWIWEQKGSNYYFKEFNALAEMAHSNEGWLEVRKIAYKSAEEQLGMIFDELMKTGTLSIDGEWASHVKQIKEEIPKHNPKAIESYYEKQRAISDQTMIDAGKADQVIKR